MITSAAQLIDDVLGGTSATARMFGLDMRVVSNWKMRGKVPAEYFLSISQRCEDEIDPAVFGMKTPTAEVSA